MLNILTEALLLAAGQRPASTAQRRTRDAIWGERFASRQTRDLD